MKTPPLFALLALAVLSPLPAQEPDDIVVEVNVLPGKGGAGKFDQANITREENKVIQAPFAGAPGSSIEHVVAAPDGSLYLCGSLAGPPARELPFTKASAVDGNAFVARLTPDARTMKAIIRLPAQFATARRIAVGPDGSVSVAGEQSGGSDLAVAKLSPELDSVLWKRSVTGNKVASVSVGPDGSVVVCPVSKPFVSRIAPDGSKLVPFGSSETFRIDGGNPDVRKAWWDGNGYPDAGYPGGVTYLRGGNAGVVALPDGTFVHFSCHFLRHPGGGPDFDPMLLRFDADGKILWCTNLLDGLPAESDQKQPGLALDPHTGDLLLSAIQHGHFAKNLIFTEGAWQNPHPYLTGDIMIGWVARVDPSTGKPKAGTYFFPEKPGPLVGGKKRANSLFPLAPAADASGNLYVTGGSAYKFETTLHAFQSEGNSGTFIAAFTPDLGRILYASLVSSPGYELTSTAIAVAPGGPVTVGNYTRKSNGPADFSSANADATNFLLSAPNGPKGGFLNYTPSGPWLE